MRDGDCDGGAVILNEMTPPDLFEFARQRQDDEREAAQEALQRVSAQERPMTSPETAPCEDDTTALPRGCSRNKTDIADDFAIWKLEPGSRHVLRDMHAMAAGYAKRFHRTGQRVSVRLLWERERDKIKAVRLRLRSRGTDIEKWNGYRLNNDFHALIARHILNRHPEWDGLFELRERR